MLIYLEAAEASSVITLLSHVVQYWAHIHKALMEKSHGKSVENKNTIKCETQSVDDWILYRFM